MVGAHCVRPRTFEERPYVKSSFLSEIKEININGHKI